MLVKIDNYDRTRQYSSADTPAFFHHRFILLPL